MWPIFKIRFYEFWRSNTHTHTHMCIYIYILYVFLPLTLYMNTLHNCSTVIEKTSVVCGYIHNANTPNSGYEIFFLVIKVKVKHPHYRPGQAQRVRRKLRFPDFVTTA